MGYNGGLFSQSGLPRAGSLTIAESRVKAAVHIDTLGIPHIFSEDLNGSAYAIGYLHARDRYFQMELLANSVMGRLSEMIGEDGVGSDKMWKGFEFESKAEEIYKKLALTHPELHQYLKHYEQGVNKYLAEENSAQRDPMYLVWNYEPRPWKAHYSFLLQWYMSFKLTMYDDYFGKQEILDKLPAEARRILYPDFPGERPTIVPGPAGTARGQLRSPGAPVKLFEPHQANRYEPRPFNKSLGSNNWVVGPKKTRDGQLFLCNDLHLFLASPNLFYELQVHSPALHAYGFTIPGVPVILSGHNERIAWGITNGGWDVTEQYLLKMKPGNADAYWLDGKWEPLQIRKLSVNVKGGEPVHFTVKHSRFGPVVERDTITYAWRWYPNEYTSGIQSLWKLMQAQNWQTFGEALREYDYPSQNFAYSDVEGNIGMICAGKMPLKPAGYAGGLFDGTMSRQWQYIPYDSLPKSFNPARGYLFSANQEPLRGKYYFAARWYDDLYRPQRINDLLSASSRVDYKDMQRMQLDQVDLSVNDLKALLRRHTQPGRVQGLWQSVLTWDGDLNGRRQEAAFYQVFRRSAGKVSAEIAQKVGVRAGPTFDQLMNFMLHHDSVSVNGHALHSRAYFLRLQRLTDSLYNADRENFDNGAAYAFSIPQFTFLPAFDKTFSDVGGSENTINVNYGAHPVIRTIIAIRGTGINSYMLNAIGQTGRLNEEDYYQQLDAWKSNALHRTQFVKSPAQLKAIATKIIFTPTP